MSSKKALAKSWSFYFLSKKQGINSAEQYGENIHFLGQFDTIEGFWSIYSHMQRPNNFDNSIDYHLFREKMRAVWEDPENREGGKWVIRLQKGLASYYWEKLIIGLIGEQFPIDVLGAVVSVRATEDLISVWNKTATDEKIRHKICCCLCLVLNLPPDTKLEYKKHNDAVKDGTSFKNSVIIYQAGKEEPFEISPKRSTGPMRRNEKH